jgi:2-phosphoglycerate kinase
MLQYGKKGEDTMVILIAGSTHTGKTALAQRILEEYRYPYLSIDHLKMGLIRSGNTDLTPMDDEKLTGYLWPIVREMIKTAIENKQNLVVEGCYIPFHWAKDFSESYLEHIRYICLIFSRSYIENHFADIQRYGSVIESRLDDSGLDKGELIRENEEILAQCKAYNCPYLLTDDRYEIDLRTILKM